MQVKEAVVKRIKSICEKEEMAYNELAVKSGITPSTLYSMLDGTEKTLALLLLRKFVMG